MADFITHINGNQELSEMVNECLNENNEEELNYDSFIEYISLMKKEMNKIKKITKIMKIMIQSN